MRVIERWITVWIIGKIVFFHLTSLEDFSCRVWGATVETDLGGEISKPKVSRSIHWYPALLSHTRWSFLVVGSSAPSIRTLVCRQTPIFQPTSVIRGNRRTSGRIWVATSHRLWQHAVTWIAEGAWMIFFLFCKQFTVSLFCETMETTHMFWSQQMPRQSCECSYGRYSPTKMGSRGATILLR